MDEERELGEQPLAALLLLRGLKHHALVEASAGRVTHKMVSRAESGRRLTHHSKMLVLAAFNAATGESLHLDDLFNY